MDPKKMALTTLWTWSNLSEVNLEITSHLESWVGVMIIGHSSEALEPRLAHSCWSLSRFL